MKSELPFLLVFTLLLVSCDIIVHHRIDEAEQVIEVEKSYAPKLGKFHVTTTTYHFFTNTLYTIGDTVYVSKSKF